MHDIHDLAIILRINTSKEYCLALKFYVLFSVNFCNEFSLTDSDLRLILITDVVHIGSFFYSSNRNHRNSLCEIASIAMRRLYNILAIMAIKLCYFKKPTESRNRKQKIFYHESK